MFVIQIITFEFLTVAASHVTVSAYRHSDNSKLFSHSRTSASAASCCWYCKEARHNATSARFVCNLHLICASSSAATSDSSEGKEFHAGIYIAVDWASSLYCQKAYKTVSVFLPAHHIGSRGCASLDFYRETWWTIGNITPLERLRFQGTGGQEIRQTGSSRIYSLRQEVLALLAYQVSLPSLWRSICWVPTSAMGLMWQWPPLSNDCCKFTEAKLYHDFYLH